MPAYPNPTKIPLVEMLGLVPQTVDGRALAIAMQRGPCRAATTANITLSGEQTIDGVAVVASERVLVKSQSTGVENGIWLAQSGAWIRANDFGGAGDGDQVEAGVRLWVTEGTVNARTEWYVSTANPITVGTTSITFANPAILSLPAAVFANPTGAIGLTAVNGTALTAMRSDGAPALSQAIIPTWTGKHVFQAGILQNTGFFSDTFTGSGAAANMGHNLTLAAAQAATPEIGMQVTLSSAVGIGNKATAYKIGFTASVIATANSANPYGGNIIVQGYAGGTGNLLTGLEVDINQLGAHANTLGAATAANGFVSVAAGDHDSTAAFWATAAPSAGRWTYGFAGSDTITNSIKEAVFYAEGQSTRVLYSLGTHTTGVDFLSATLTYAMAVKNNIPIVSYDSAAAIKNVLKLNASDQVEIGYAAGGQLHLGTSQWHRMATDENILFRGHIDLANGATITSVNDANNALKGMQILGDWIYLNASAGQVRFGTYTGGAATDSTGYVTITDSGGTARKLMVQA